VSDRIKDRFDTGAIGRGAQYLREELLHMEQDSIFPYR